MKNNASDPKPDEPTREPQWKPPGPDTIPHPDNPSQFPEQNPNEVPSMDPNEIPDQKNLYYEGV